MDWRLKMVVEIITKKFWQNILLICLIFFSRSLLAVDQKPTLTLAEFLQQVRAQHYGFRAAQEGAAAALSRAEEADVMLSPKVFANAQNLIDEKETANPTFQGTKTTASSVAVGVAKQTSFGLQTKLSYNLGYTDIDGTTPLPGIQTSTTAYEAGPRFEVSQSLWRNAFGAETQASRELIDAQANLAHYNEQYKTKLILLEAEMAYWRLALSRETIDVQNERLVRATKLRNWSANRVKAGLADRADLLQSQAAVRVSELELQMAIDDEKTSARALNLLRGNESDQVFENLPKLKGRDIADLEIPKRQLEREDVLASKQAERLARAQAKVGSEKYTPTLEFFGAVAMNGRDQQLGAAQQESFKTDHPTYVVGLRFSAELDFALVKKIKTAYYREHQAAELSARQRQLVEQKEWQDLTRKFDEAKNRFKLISAIELAQKQKVDHERLRYNRGRSTTAQVLMFEQDFSQSQLNRIRIQGEILGISAQMTTFSDIQ